MDVKNETSTTRAERTRATLVRHARSIFAEEGYADANVDDIVRRAEVTKGALYHHFRGKLDLYEGVVEEMATELAVGVETAAAAHDEPWERLEAMCDSYLDSCLESDLARILVLEAPTVLGWKRWCEIDREYVIGAFGAALERTMEGTTARSSETSAQVVLGVLNTAAQVIATSRDPMAAREEVEATLKRLLAGLRSAP